MELFYRKVKQWEYHNQNIFNELWQSISSILWVAFAALIKGLSFMLYSLWILLKTIGLLIKSRPIYLLISPQLPPIERPEIQNKNANSCLIHPHSLF